MSRYIDADKIIEFINNRFEITWTSDDYEGGIKDACCDILEVVERQPTADVKPVVRGEWIYHPEKKNVYGGKTIECSHCHTQYIVQYIEDELFCRNCGARMVEE